MTMMTAMLCVGAGIVAAELLKFLLSMVTVSSLVTILRFAVPMLTIAAFGWMLSGKTALAIAHLSAVKSLLLTARRAYTLF